MNADKHSRYHLQIRVDPEIRPHMRSMTDAELESFVLICRECGIIGNYPPGVAVPLSSLVEFVEWHESVWAVRHSG